jgi:hypothetical protein
MFRPVTITHPVVVNDGKPFEALIASPSFDTNDGTLSMIYFENDVQTVEILEEGLDDEEGSLLCILLEWQLAQALNPPIKVTQAVLDAMEKVPVAKFRKVINDCRNEYTYNCSYSTVHGGWYTYHPIPKSLKIGDYIQADCPLALHVLLGFTVEGVPKDA